MIDRTLRKDKRGAGNRALYTQSYNIQYNPSTRPRWPFASASQIFTSLHKASQYHNLLPRWHVPELQSELQSIPLPSAYRGACMALRRCTVTLYRSTPLPICCQQRLLGLLEEKHKAAFPTATHDTDSGRCYVLCAITRLVFSKERSDLDLLFRLVYIHSYLRILPFLVPVH